MKSRTIPIAVAVALIVGGSATAGSLITSAQIKDHTIQARDLSPAALRALRGRPGPQGTEGPAGITQINHVDGTPVAACAQGGGSCQVAAATATCPPGEAAVGGGYVTDGNSTNLSVAYSATRSASSWGVIVTNHDTNSTIVTARVLCIPGTGSRHTDRAFRTAARNAR